MSDAAPRLRWRYPHPSEDAERAEVISQIDGWWKAFTENAHRFADYFSGRDRWDLPAWMQRHLRSVVPGVAWEFGPGRRNPEGERLMITPEADHHQRPLVELLLARAPAVPGWEFYPYRLPEDLETAAGWVKARTGAGVDGWSAYAQSGEGGLVDVSFSPPRGLFRRSDKDREVAFVATECLLGEECLNSWIGAIEVERRPDARPLTELRGRVSALIDEATARLPAEPFWKRAEKVEWSLLELKPEGADDYPGQIDLFVAKTMDLPLWQAQHSPVPFRGRRFSRLGETFCSLKIDGSVEAPADGFQDKSEIEDAVDEALLSRELGCHIGGGTGLRYSYVDLAVTDVNAAVQALWPVLRQGKLPSRTWMLFFEAELADEWIPLWDDTPSPPR